MDQLISPLRRFFVNSWLSYIGLFAWMKPHAYIASKIIGPIGEMIFFVMLGIFATGETTADFYIVGNAIHMAALNGIFGVTGVIGGERHAGTLKYLIGSPASRLSIFLGRSFFTMLDGILTVLFCFSLGLLMGLNLEQTNFPILFLTIAITSFSACGFGLLLGSLCLLSVNIGLVENMFFTLLLLFSGANLPYEKMPAWIQTVGSYLPLSHGVQCARLLVKGAKFTDVWQILIGEIVIGILYTLLGLALFRLLEYLARHKGTLENV